jgi:hypothetical protein
LSQIKFDGEGEMIASEHACKLWKFCCSHNNTNGSVICRLFSLTFAGRVKSWCETLSTVSIHTWEQFMCQFWHDFENYDYDDFCAEISELQKNEDESLEDFVMIFNSSLL